MLTRTVRCADCLAELPERENVAREWRQPCSGCKSLNRLLEVETTGHVSSDQHVKLSLYSDPRLRPEWGMKTSERNALIDDWQEVKVLRRFDLDRGTYSECVERLDDGTVLRKIERSLHNVHYGTLISDFVNKERVQQQLRAYFY